MKVLIINGSPRANGNTDIALREMEKVFAEEGVETKRLNIGTQMIHGCVACNACHRTGKCGFDDVVNRAADILRDCDGLVVGTPVYYAPPSGRLLCALDRAFYAGGAAFRHKPGAAVAVARRGGTTASFDVLNKYFTICEMPVVASTYWNNVHGRLPGEAAQDAEGLQTMRNIGQNMAWLLKCIEAGKAAGIDVPVAERGQMTNYIR